MANEVFNADFEGAGPYPWSLREPYLDQVHVSATTCEVLREAWAEARHYLFSGTKAEVSRLAEKLRAISGVYVTIREYVRRAQ